MLDPPRIITEYHERGSLNQVIKRTTHEQWDVQAKARKDLSWGNRCALGAPHPGLWMHMACTCCVTVQRGVKSHSMVGVPADGRALVFVPGCSTHVGLSIRKTGKAALLLSSKLEAMSKAAVHPDPIRSSETGSSRALMKLLGVCKVQRCVASNQPALHRLQI